MGLFSKRQRLGTLGRDERRRIACPQTRRHFTRKSSKSVSSSAVFPGRPTSDRCRAFYEK
jgi:hypothetical protein